MDYADAIRRQAEDAPRAALPAVTAALWRAFGDGHVTEAEAEALSVLIEGRLASGAARGLGQSSNPIGTGSGAATVEPRALVQAGRLGVGSRPRTDASMERRRRWAASGRLPPALAARFTLAEQAVLALVAAETARRGDCRLSVPHIAALVGVAETTVRNAIREARGLGLITVEERKVTSWRNDTNVVRIISPEWSAWLRLARRGGAPRNGAPPRLVATGGGCKSAKGTPTKVSTQGKTRTVSPSRRSPAPLDPTSQEALRTANARPRRCAVEGAAPGPR
jgi:hypothetical protein